MLAGIKRSYRRKGEDVYVLAYAGDGGTADVGFQCLSGAAERDEAIIYICYDNEGYMNTGIQRSGTTPYKAWTTTTPVGEVKRGKPQVNKNMPLIMAMHEIPFAATASIAYLHDYVSKLKEAAKVEDGLAYIHLFTPCPTGWRFSPDRTVEVARLAVETNFFPLWEARYGKLRFTKKIWFRKPVREYLKIMGKYSHLTDGEIEEIQRLVDERYRMLKSLAR
jgi:pyruvate/2-oxoacid:ferredoxin oxidoreductase beta subunit